MIAYRDLFYLSYLKLKVRRKRMWFAIMGVAFGVSLIAIAATLIYNGKQLFIEESSKRFVQIGGIEVNNPKQGMDKYATTIDINKQPNRLKQSDIDQIKQITGKDNVYAVRGINNDIFVEKKKNYHEPWLNFGESHENYLYMLKGTQPEYIYKILGNNLNFQEENNTIPIVLTSNNGYLFGLSADDLVNNPELFINKIYTLNIKSGYFGEKPANLAAQELKFKVVAISDKIDYSYIPEATLIAIQKWLYQESYKNYDEQALADYLDSYENINVLTNSSKELNDTVAALENAGYETYSLVDVLDEAKEFFRIIKWLFLTAGSVVLLIILFMVMNVIGKNISDSTKEIGIFKTLGAQKKDIRKIFMMQTFIITSIGSIIGLIMGYFGTPLGIYLFFTMILKSRPTDIGATNDIFGNPWQIASRFMHFPIIYFLGILVATVAVCVLVSWGRANRGAKLNPILALKEE